jgi:hypothetical protein
LKILQLLDEKWFHVGEEIARGEKKLCCDNNIEFWNVGKLVCKLKGKLGNRVTARQAVYV